MDASRRSGAERRLRRRAGAPRSPHAAASTLEKPDLGQEAQKVGLEVRWGAKSHPLDPSRRYDETDAALTRLDSLIAEAAAAATPDSGLLTRLRRDRIVALRDRERSLLVASKTLARAL